MVGIVALDLNRKIDVVEPAIGLTFDAIVCVGTLGRDCTLEGYHYVPGSRTKVASSF